MNDDSMTIDRIQVEFSTNLETLIASLHTAESQIDAVNNSFARSETASQSYAASMEQAGTAAAASSEGFAALATNIDSLSGSSAAGAEAAAAYANAMNNTQGAITTINYQMYRTGAPIMFIQIDQPKGERRGPKGELIQSDVNYAKSILSSWGQKTSFTLRENMTVHTIDVKEGSLAKIGIELAAQTIQDYISPVGMLGKDGLLISGNSNASLKLINNHNQGWIRLLKNHLRNLPNYYLQHNGYPDEWHAEVNIPMITLEDTTARLNQASLLASTKTGTVNEIRELAGVEGVSDDELEKLMMERKILEADMSPVPFTPLKEDVE